jgi:DNA-binding NarL/FixJ family response regulator
MIKLLIADDHPIVREGLKQILKDDPDIVVLGEANDGKEALNKIRKEKYDVVLLDISMPKRNGVEILDEVRKEKVQPRILILSIHPEEQYAIRALRAGAYGYITKDSAPNELISAIKKISMGKKYISPSLAEKLVGNLGVSLDKTPHEVLSSREFQILLLLASGKRETEIATELFLSIKTVSTYKARILRKMKMKSTFEIIYYAIKNRLIE